MENHNKQIYCRFVAVYDCFLLLALAGVSGFAFGVFFGLEIFLFIPSGTYVVLSVLLTIFSFLLLVGAGAGSSYGVELLWNKRGQGNRRYLVYLIVSILVVIVGIIAGCVFLGYGMFNLAINISFMILCTITGIMNAVGFFLKRKEPVQEPKKQKRRVEKNTEEDNERREKNEQVPTGSILGIRGEYAGVVFPIKADEKLYFGKSTKYCQIVLSDPHISRVHLCVCYRADLKIYEVTDYSKNGTFLEDGERFPNQITCQCKPGTIFTMEHGRQMFQLI
ncbi:MAG: FHA domain-containing protein [Lachnospiraceae bacterium]